MNRRVVITGMGVVAPNGNGLEAYEAALRAGVSGIRHIPLLQELKFGCTVAGVPPDADALAGTYFDEDDLLAMNSNQRFGCIAAVDAWTDAGFERPEHGDDHVYWEAGAVIGTGVGGLDTAGEKLVPMTDAGRVRRMGSTIVEQIMGSGVSARVSGMLALGNQVTSNSSACSTGAEAIVGGYERIKNGLADRMLCGGSEGSSHYIWAGFDAMRVLARKFNDEPEKASRPLSATAAGFIPGSGAAILHLESLENAEQRGARIYAELLGGSLNCGGHRQGGSMTAPNQTSVRRCIREAVANAGITSDEIDAI
ncbi:MAG TPA: beta-ketoacyl-ACP synthase, partial [Gemmatimonadetes bacterium]|nr:beta-ketoacyl-ACP synthase [Gemmatimonadota bacterium]